MPLLNRIRVWAKTFARRMYSAWLISFLINGPSVMPSK